MNKTEPTSQDRTPEEGIANQIVHVQSEEAPYRGRHKHRFDPDRHYCWHEVPNDDWDSDAIDNLLDEIDPQTGEAAYRIEADGSTEEGRRITGSRRKMWLSCSAQYAHRKASESSNRSELQRLAVQRGELRTEERDLLGQLHDVVETESLKEKKAVPLKGIIGV